MKKYLKIMSFVALLSTGVNFNTERVSADTTRIKGSLPTTINLTEATDSQVSAYYSGVTEKKGNELLETLYHTIKNHEEYSYDSSTDRNIYKIIDRDWDLSPLLNSAGYDYSSDNPYINKLYADYNGDTETADKFKNDDASRVSFDKEHIWPQSLGNFGRTAGAGSDFHALWPSDVKINQHAHNNNHYAVPTRSIKNYDNDKESYGGRNGFMDLPNTGKVFEPLDEYKGDIARAMFCMPARYFVYEDKTHPKLELVNGTPDAVTASSTITGKAGDLATLLEWHENDPVDEYEIRRNNLIYNNYQKIAILLLITHNGHELRMTQTTLVQEPQTNPNQAV